jgi:hypothetical protein
VQVRVRLAGVDGSDELVELAAGDALSERIPTRRRRATAAEHVVFVEGSRDGRRCSRTCLRPGRTVAEVTAEEHDDRAVDAALREVDVRLQHVSFEVGVAQPPGDGLPVLAHVRREVRMAGRRECRNLLVADQRLREVVEAGTRPSRERECGRCQRGDANDERREEALSPHALALLACPSEDGRPGAGAVAPRRHWNYGSFLWTGFRQSDEPSDTTAN